MNALISEFRLAVRRQITQPALTIPAFLCLAIGIGPTVAVFDAVDKALLGPLPFPGHARVVRLVGITLSPRHRPLERFNNVELFEALGMYKSGLVNLQTESETTRIVATQVSNGFLELAGLTPETGRLFDKDDQGGRHGCVAVADHALLSLVPGAAVGQVVRLDGHPCTVVGVMRAGPAFPPTTVLWLPLPESPGERPSLDTSARLPGGVPTTGMLGRLRRGITLQLARDWVAAEQRRIEDDSGLGHSDVGLQRVRDMLVGDRRPALLLAQAVVSWHSLWPSATWRIFSWLALCPAGMS